MEAPDAESGMVVPLFHPRQDRWEEHFQILSESHEVAGRTPVGRATAERLRLNAPLMLKARGWWARLGLFP
jgi:hypothetical protein